jgi:AcrR family transcriptional regulator
LTGKKRLVTPKAHKTMGKQERSERSRAQILNAALKLFSHRGYGATTLREIGEAAGLSHGNVYYYFPDKEKIFRALLQRWTEIVADPEQNYIGVLARGVFPDNLEELGSAIRDLMRDNKEYATLVYVDVVEFEGEHVRQFYAGLARAFEAFLKEKKMERPLKNRMQQGLSPTSVILFAARTFVNYFAVEIVFGVKNHYGKSSDEAVREISHIIRHGVLANGHPFRGGRDRSRKSKR